MTSMFEKQPTEDPVEKINAYHAMDAKKVLKKLGTSEQGLKQRAVQARFQQYGLNEISQQDACGFLILLIKELKSPMIYVLVLAALFSIFVMAWADAFFISVVIIANAFIGASQEYSSIRTSNSLQDAISTNATVMRDGEIHEIDASLLVPGDIVHLKTGDCVPADLRLITSSHLELDESVLSAQNSMVAKEADCVVSATCSLSKKKNMVFSGTSVVQGKGTGVVIATGLKSQYGSLSRELLNNKPPKAPLLQRLESFTKAVAIIIGIFTILMAIIAFMQGMGMRDIFLLATALMVSAIPEGLPMVLTGALGVSMRRMATKNIIIKKMVAVEALGCCTCIIAEKTGVFTQNNLSIRRVICFPDFHYDIVGKQKKLQNDHLEMNEDEALKLDGLMKDICEASVFANEGLLVRKEGNWVLRGNPLDTALLVMSHRMGVARDEMDEEYKVLDQIAFDSRRKYSAALLDKKSTYQIALKGAVEVCLLKCTHMQTINGPVPIDADAVQAMADKLAKQGLRAVAIAAGVTDSKRKVLEEGAIKNLTLLGLVGAQDPIRPDAAAAINQCAQAGVDTIMFSGDNSLRALAIAKELGLTKDSKHIITGLQIENTSSEEEKNALILQGKVFVRLDIQQKIDVIDVLEDEGHFVGYLGTVAKDAPVIKRAHVGIATGTKSSDVVKETAEIVVANDSYVSMVAGIEQGRIAYENIRKIIYLIISTSVAEIVLFSLALLSGLPIPLIPVQLLWLNLATNVIQDLALAFEPGSGNELKQKPRKPDEPIFNRLMIERVVLGAIWMGVLAFMLFCMIYTGEHDLDQARNSTLLLMVLFANTHVFNSRSESVSVFKQNIFSNRFLLFGTIAAQLIHMLAMYTPSINQILKIEPVSFGHWISLLFMAMSLIVVMEFHKLFKKKE